MRWTTTMLLVCGALLVVGCGLETAETAEQAPSGAAAEPAGAPEEWCRVCEVDKGEKLPEYLPSRLDAVRDGQTYQFCNDGCRQKFDADPARYLMPDAADPAAERTGTVDAADGAR